MRRGVLLSLLTLAPLALASPASAQLMPSPTNNFHAAVNGMATLCPTLVAGEPVPDAAAAAPYGFRPINAPAQAHHFESLFTDGLVRLHFEPALGRCTVHYGGAGFREIAGVARDLATHNGFTRITGGISGGAQGDVYDLTDGEPPRRFRYIVIENPTSQTAAVNYSERTDP